MAADRQLLFGLLALQNGIVNQGQLVAAFQAWTLDRSRSLADHLVDRGDIDDEDRTAIDALVTRHLKRHGGDVEKSLVAVPAGRSMRESLARLGDADIATSLGHLGAVLTRAATDGDHTASYDINVVISSGSRFRVLRPHASGGLGAVFVALDAELNREVALKQILPRHADDPDSRRRFLLEAEITGGLEHPGMVPVYGLGTDALGRPYYAMRFIRGDSLKEAIAQFHADGRLQRDAAARSLELRKLLRRFLDVCNAIEYAHSRGVLHRDIKPSNIIVGRHGETLVADWGLAKALGRIDAAETCGERPLVPSPSSGTAETLPGRALGTPAYMSPEQAAGDLDRVDARSDVYGLGATLYSLLTGRPPFAGRDVGEVLRAVGRGEVMPPRAVNPSIDRPLEAVCQKAMNVEPRDRYASARALADDLERWMADERVSAWSEPFSRRAFRWMRRHRTFVITATAAVLVALLGVGAILVMRAQTNAELRAANAVMQDRFTLAINAIKTFHSGVSDDVLLKQSEFADLRGKLLRESRDFYRRLEDTLRGQADRSSRRALGQAYFEVAELTAKIGSVEDALAVHRQALALRRDLLAESPDAPEVRADLCDSLKAVGLLLNETNHPDEALSHLLAAKSALEGVYRTDPAGVRLRAGLASCLTGIGLVQSRTGHSSQASDSFGDARAILEKLTKDDPANTQFQNDLATTYLKIGWERGRSSSLADPLASYERARAILESLAKAHPTVSRFQIDLADTLGHIGSHLESTGRSQEALTAFGRALSIQEALTKAYPTISEFQTAVALSHHKIGSLQSRLGHPTESLIAL